ncbi:MAG TPA: HAD family hydrolase [Mucilaginibacter sp.]|jgi:putative hydrolase of the HAD superfamily|nr:HAD family hydrolase [Mucilaginibacter sp.]
MKQALILDLDNTIYPVSSIAEHLFERLFWLLDQTEDGTNYEKIKDAKDELKRRPFHLVADKYNFGEELTEKGIDLLKNMAYDLPMQPFEDYRYIQSANIPKFLVTTGFSKLQWSKVNMLGIGNDFAEIHIVDPETSQQTKREVFADIMNRHFYSTDELLVVGDDPESEIKAAGELGIDTFLFDPENKHPGANATYKSVSLRDVLNHIS